MYAARNGRLEVVNALREAAGINVNLRDDVSVFKNSEFFVICSTLFMLKWCGC